MSQALIIAGPTASGKSSAAISLAQKLGGEIVNADALQIYSELRILTARPSIADELLVPHHLYGISKGDDQWSAGRYARAAAETLREITTCGSLPIVVGGTGLWLKALTTGLSPIPNISPEILREAHIRLEKIGLDSFRKEVIAADPEMKRLTENDRQRHLRAWSVYRQTGRPLSIWQKEPAQKLTDLSFLKIVLMPPRELSHAQVENRLDLMIDMGAIEEVREIIQKNYPENSPIMKAVGVPELSAYLQGNISIEDAKERTIISTRQLVKRQSTWFNGQFADWIHVGNIPEAIDHITDYFENLPPR